MKNQFLEAGKIVGTHGLKGEVRVDPWCDSAEFLAKFKRLYYKDGTELKVISSRPHKNITIIHLEGVNDVNAADGLRGRVLYINRDDVKLPDGSKLHEDPSVPNYGTPGRGVRLLPGMTIAIEPMINAGGHEVKVLSDRWTTVTADGSLSAHFEHTIAITSDGPVIMTLP